MSKNRSFEMDLMKIVSCLAVIIIHITATPATMALAPGASAPPIQLVSIFLNGISLFAVPSFLLISGMGLMLGYKNREIRYTDFVLKRCKVIVIPYIIWCLSYYFFYAAIGLRELTLKEFLQCLLLGRANYHLYYIPIMLQLYLVFPLLKQILNKLDTRIGFLFIIFAHLGFHYGIPQFPFRDRFFMSYFIFFAIGILFGKHFEGIRLILKTYWMVVLPAYLVTAATFVLGKYSLYVHGSGTILNWFQLWPIFSIISTIALFTAAAFISDRIESSRTTSMVVNLSSATFYVYLTHPMLLIFTQRAYRMVGLNSTTAILFLNFVILTVTCFTIALLYLKKRGKLQPVS